MKNKLLLLFSFCFMFIITIAGNKNVLISDADKAKTRKLIIITSEPGEKYLQKAEEKGGHDHASLYKVAIDNMNENLIKLVDSRWKLHEEYEMKSVEEVAALSEQGNDDYVVLWVSSISNSVSGNTIYQTSYPDLFWPANKDEYENPSLVMRSSENQSAMSLTLIENFKEFKYLSASPLPHSIPTLTDMAYAMDYIAYTISLSANADKNKLRSTPVKTIPQYTLAICKDDLDEGFGAEEIKAAYNHKFEIFSREQLDSLVLNNTSGYAYVVLMLGEMSIGSTETGKLLLFTFGGNNSNIDKMISEKDFKALVKNIERSKEGKLTTF